MRKGSGAPFFVVVSVCFHGSESMYITSKLLRFLATLDFRERRYICAVLIFFFLLNLLNLLNLLILLTRKKNSAQSAQSATRRLT